MKLFILTSSPQISPLDTQPISLPSRNLRVRKFYFLPNQMPSITNWIVSNLRAGIYLLICIPPKAHNYRRLLYICWTSKFQTTTVALDNDIMCLFICRNFESAWNLQLPMGASPRIVQLTCFGNFSQMQYLRLLLLLSPPSPSPSPPPTKSEFEF